MQIEKTIKIDISDKDIEIVRLIAEGETKNKITAENTMIMEVLNSAEPEPPQKIPITPVRGRRVKF
jgi:hypothetical protein